MKLTKYQLFWLLFSTEIGLTYLLTIAPMFKDAKQGAPLAMCLAGAASVLVTLIAVKLSLLYPEETFVTYVPRIVGKWLGKTIVFAYLLLWIVHAGFILRQYADFVHMTLFSATPLWVLVVCMVLVVIYAVHGGLHIVGRCSELIGPFLLLSIVLIMLLSIPNLRPSRLLPLLPTEGWIAVFKGGESPASFLSESFLTVMLVAFLADKKKALSSSLWGVGVTCIVLMYGVLNVLMILDNTVPAKLQYPVYSVIQYISIMEFIQNLDILMVVGTIFSIFIKLCLYMFMTSYGTAQLVSIRNWRKILWVVGVIVFTIALYPRSVNESQEKLPLFWKNVVFPIFLVAIPLLLWIIGNVRLKMKRSQQTKVPSP
ncbi:endospore germination permease [Paenibacillus sp. 5J-6]|uniref:Endospore germination permease n=1 Tax=Paenibacillus silvestris TaxID=2606219 RepID=A0A6L8UTX5_9BACL|nr:endospore germination permease [Paenibacillus silvestris]MZQ81334.1 endospore germination permease [Paenibacillus silvestris]